MNIEAVIRTIYAALALALAVLSGTLAVNGVDELESRRYYRLVLDEKIAYTQSEIARVAAKKVPLNVQGLDVDALESQLVDINAAKAALRSLVETGASSNRETLNRIKLRFIDTRDSADVLMGGWLPQLTSMMGYSPNTLRDDSVLAGVMFFAAFFGSCIAAVRSPGAGISRLVLGGITGLFVYFLLKGGKVIFIQGADSAWVSYNPYSFAFAGMLAGLFSESSYRTLGFATDSIMERWLKLLQNDSPKKPDSK